jgi:hypothetical protein
MSMGRRYAQTGQLTSAASTSRAVFIATAGCRPKTNFIMLSAINATPNDYVNEYNVKRISAIGSLAVTARTPTALDSGDPASAIVGGAALTGINATGEPTYTASSEVLMFSHNMHAVFAWYAPDGGEIVQPASATAGLGLFFVGGTTAYSDAMTWHYSE